VYACAYAGPPERSRPEVWRASGIAFYKVSPGEASPRLLLDVAPGPRDVEYSVDGDRLVLVLYTYDPRAPFAVPLLRESLPIPGDGVEPRAELLLEPPAADPARVESIFAQLRARRPSDPTGLLAQLQPLLFELRNQGLRDPRAMRSRLQELRKRWWRKADPADPLTAVIAELERVERTTSPSPEP
jgi:hypothetical protein